MSEIGLHVHYDDGHRVLRRFYLHETVVVPRHSTVQLKWSESSDPNSDVSTKATDTITNVPFGTYEVHSTYTGLFADDNQFFQSVWINPVPYLGAAVGLETLWKGNHIRRYVFGTLLTRDAVLKIQITTQEHDVTIRKGYLVLVCID